MHKEPKSIRLTYTCCFLMSVLFILVYDIFVVLDDEDGNL